MSEVVGFVELPGVPTRCGRAGFRLGFVYAGAGTVSIEVGRNVMASRLRFCAIAVSKNSSRAPLRPRSRSRSTRRMCFMWANRISTFFRSRRERRSGGLAECPSHIAAVWPGLDGQLVSSISQGRERCLIACPTTCVAFSPIYAALSPVPCWTAHSSGCHVAARSQGRETP